MSLGEVVLSEVMGDYNLSFVQRVHYGESRGENPSI